MKDPRRLLEASASELELHLLRAGAAEQPPAAALQRLLNKHQLVASTSALPPTAAPKLSLLPIGIVAAGITLAGAVWMSNRPAPLPAASEPSRSVAQAPEAVAVPVPQAPESVPTHSLALEIARIDAIRLLLKNDRAKSAIVAAQDYQRDFPSGVLRQEAEALTIEAHQRAGERRRARTLASRFLAEHPESPHSARVRELLGSDAR